MSSCWDQPGRILAFESLVSWEESRFGGSSPIWCPCHGLWGLWGFSTTYLPSLPGGRSATGRQAGWVRERSFCIGPLKEPGLHSGLGSNSSSLQCLCGVASKAANLPARGAHRRGLSIPDDSEPALCKPVWQHGRGSSLSSAAAPFPFSPYSAHRQPGVQRPAHSSPSCAISLLRDPRHRTAFSGPHFLFTPIATI